MSGRESAPSIDPDQWIGTYVELTRDVDTFGRVFPAGSFWFVNGHMHGDQFIATRCAAPTPDAAYFNRKDIINGLRPTHFRLAADYRYRTTQEN